MKNKILMTSGFTLFSFGGCCLDSTGIGMVIAGIAVMVGLILMCLVEKEVEM